MYIIIILQILYAHYDYDNGPDKVASLLDRILFVTQCIYTVFCSFLFRTADDFFIEDTASSTIKAEKKCLEEKTVKTLR